MNAKKARFKKKAYNRATKIGGRVHTDLKHVPLKSTKGYEHAACFVDCYSRRGRVYFLKHKSEFFDVFVKYFFECKQAGVKVECLRSDCGGEYESEDLAAFCRMHGTRRELSPPHCASAHGVAESYWRETFKFVRTILHDQQRPNTMWPQALHFADYIRNRLSSTVVPDHPPEVLWSGAPIDTKHMRTPLSACFTYIEKELREKPRTLAKRRIQGIFVGYATDSKCYYVYHPQTKKVVARRYEDVEFVEQCKAISAE